MRIPKLAAVVAALSHASHTSQRSHELAADAPCGTCDGDTHHHALSRRDGASASTKPSTSRTVTVSSE